MGPRQKFEQKKLEAFDYLLGAAVSVAVLFLDFLCFLAFAVSVEVVFCANTATPDKSDRPSAAVMIILIFWGISLGLN
jgi:hypothetical protein